MKDFSGKKIHKRMRRVFVVPPEFQNLCKTIQYNKLTLISYRVRPKCLEALLHQVSRGYAYIYWRKNVLRDSLKTRIYEYNFKLAW